MIAAIAGALAPIALVVLLGWFAGRRALLPEGAKAALAAFVVKFALPLALFLAAVDSDPHDILNPPYLAALAVGLIGTWAAGLLVSRLLLRRPMPEAAMQGLAAGFPNMAYAGPPVLAAVGSGAILAVVIGNLIVSLIVMPATLVLLGGGGGTGRVLLHAVRQPLVFLPVLGAVLALLGIHVPDLLAHSIDEIGKAAGGAALFTLGLILAGITPRLDRDVIVNVLMKNIVQPALLLGAGLAFGLTGSALHEVFLIGVLPAATAVPTLALAHEIYADEAAASVLASTLFSVLTISAGIALTGVLP